jgi:hypothetical protein
MVGLLTLQPTLGHIGNGSADAPYVASRYCLASWADPHAPIASIRDFGACDTARGAFTNWPLLDRGYTLRFL